MCSHLLADVQDVCDRIAILHQGELKELGRVDELLTVQDVTQLRAKGLSKAAEDEIRAVDRAARRASWSASSIRRCRWKSCSCDIVRDSEARPGRRAREQNDEARMTNDELEFALAHSRNVRHSAEL